MNDTLPESDMAVKTTGQDMAIERPADPDGGGSERVYTQFFRLREVPFSITPDPDFLFLSGTHREVMEKIHYGIRSKMGFIVLTGEVGTGKTTLCRVLLDQLRGAAGTVYIINPALDGEELIGAILDDLGITHPAGASKKALIDRLNRYLLAETAGRPVVIIVDDAQTMPIPTLEDLRLLSNLETDKQKLLQILIVGQPELLTCLDRPELRQLKQRVTVHCSLDYLSRDEVEGYIQRRLFVAGNQGQLRFAPGAIARIHKQSEGIPRMINKICDLALTAAYAENSTTINLNHLKAASGELKFLNSSRSDQRVAGGRVIWVRRMAGAGLLIAALGIGGAAYLRPKPLPALPTAGVTEPQARVPEHMSALSAVPGIPNDGIEMGGYILQLGSFSSFDSTMRAVDFFIQKGIQTHWNTVNLDARGIWYRVYTGRYPTYQAARQYQAQMALTAAMVLFAPWTLSLGPETPPPDANGIDVLLHTGKLDSYAAADELGRRHLFSGAYVTREDAAAIAAQVFKKTGVAVDIRNCSPLLVPHSNADSSREATYS